jgi:hypothetical protein
MFLGMLIMIALNQPPIGIFLTDLLNMRPVLKKDVGDAVV